MLASPTRRCDRPPGMATTIEGLTFRIADFALTFVTTHTGRPYCRSFWSVKARSRTAREGGLRSAATNRCPRLNARSAVVAAVRSWCRSSKRNARTRTRTCHPRGAPAASASEPGPRPCSRGRAAASLPCRGTDVGGPRRRYARPFPVAHPPRRRALPPWEAVAIVTPPWLPPSTSKPTGVR